METYSRFDFLERSDGDLSIFDSNYYGINSGAEVARVFVESRVPRASLDLVQQAQMWDIARARAERVARLIQAAPEMYALLKLVHDDAFETLDEGGEAVVAISPDLIEKINLLLAKVRGEEVEK